MCESRGGRPGLPSLISLWFLCNTQPTMYYIICIIFYVNILSWTSVEQAAVPHWMSIWGQPCIIILYNMYYILCKYHILNICWASSCTTLNVYLRTTMYYIICIIFYVNILSWTSVEQASVPHWMSIWGRHFQNLRCSAASCILIFR